jgi:hypothetical protein
LLVKGNVIKWARHILCFVIIFIATYLNILFSLRQRILVIPFLSLYKYIYYMPKSMCLCMHSYT